MKKVTEFLKSNILVIKWTVSYFVILWAILQFLFNFDIFSARHWYKFFNATLHGFGGFTFGVIMYTALPLYIASTLIVYRKKTPVVTIPVPEKIKTIPKNVGKIFSTPTPEPTPEPVKEPESDSEPTIEFPPDMPPELYIPYTRAKQNVSFRKSISTFNKIQPTQQTADDSTSTENESFPIPSDFDISDSLTDDSSTNFSNNEFPVFKELDFDTPLETKPTLSNSVTKYCTEHGIAYETYQDFVATEKYLIYDHNDSDFWVMDEETWFASKKQRPSPINEMINLARQNGLIPVLYLESQNIMDIEGTSAKFESMGVRVVKNLDELK